MTAAPLMPKATAVWLVENTALSFDQVAEFCKLHPLEVKAIADSDAAQGIKGLDPIQTGQLSREEIEKAVAEIVARQEGRQVFGRDVGVDRHGRSRGRYGRAAARHRQDRVAHGPTWAAHCSPVKHVPPRRSTAHWTRPMQMPIFMALSSHRR